MARASFAHSFQWLRPNSGLWWRFLDHEASVATHRVLVLGATGGTGRHVVMCAVAQGLKVSVLCRDPDRLAPPSAGLRIFTGDITTGAASLAAAMHGQDAVICALGAGTSFTSHALMARCMPRILAAMHDAGVRRLIVTSAFGVGATWTALPLLPRLFSRLLLRDIYADKAASEVVLRESTLDWTLVYPSALGNGPSRGPYRIGERLALRGFPTIPRADVAAFLVAQLDDRQFVRRGVMIST